jgi:hypothetical protein
MHNRLREFEELLFDNTLFKVQNQILGDKVQNGRSGGSKFKNSWKIRFKKIWN